MSRWKPSNGIIAGCTQSNHFARIFLHAIISKVHEASPYNDQHVWEGVPEQWNMHITRKPWNEIRTFVDDVSQTVRAKWPVMKMIKAAKILEDGSPKGWIDCQHQNSCACIKPKGRKSSG